MRALVFLLLLLVLPWLVGCGKEQQLVTVQVQPYVRATFMLKKPLTGTDAVSAKQAALYKQLADDPSFAATPPQIIVLDDSVRIRTEAKDLATAEKHLAATTLAMEKTFGKGSFTAPTAEMAFHPAEQNLQRVVGDVLTARLKNMGIKSTVELADDGQLKITPRRAIGDREMKALTTSARLELWLLPKEITVDVDDNGTVTAMRNGKPIPADEALHNGYFVLDNNTLAKFQYTVASNGAPAIAFEATRQGAERLRIITAGNIDETMLVVLDGKILMAPVIKAAISGNGIIEGNFAEKEAQELANLLTAGQLPAKVTVVDMR